MEIKGADFVKTSVARVNGVARDTKFKDESTLLVKLVPQDVEKEGQIELTVYSPAPGGGLSVPMVVKVANATGAIPEVGDPNEQVDGCGVQGPSATKDEELPASQGGVATS